MKKNEVPQDDENLFEQIAKEIQYATDENGKYVQVNSLGWTPKNTILIAEWADIDQKAEEARLEVIKGNKSALYFHMILNQMDIKMLAGYAQMSRFKVKKLLKPKHFQKISKKDAQKLSYALNLSEENLKKIPEQPFNSLQKILKK